MAATKPKFQIKREDRATPEQRQRRLNETLAMLNKKYGSEAVVRGSEASPDFFYLKTFPSGILSLDAGTRIPGIPRGRFIEIFGPNQSGKTSTALWIIASAMKDDPAFTALYIDTEYRFDITRAYMFGVDISRLYLHQTDSGENACDIAKELLASGIDLVVFDSVTGLLPAKQLEDDGDKNYVGLHARLMSDAARVLTPMMSAYDRSRRGSVIFINQLRENPNVMHGNPSQPTGGRALGFYSSLRIQVLSQAKDDWIYNADGEMVGQWVRYNIFKNTLGGLPRADGKYPLLFHEGIDIVLDTLEAATRLGVIDQHGAYFYFVCDDGTELKGQGKDKFFAAVMEKEGAIQEIRDRCSERLAIKIDVESFQKAIEQSCGSNN